MQLKESGEMYLETIYVLHQQKGFVRSIDVCESGYLTVSKDGGLHLTEPGLEVAERTYERHTVLSELFEKLGVSEEQAVADACKIEHVISVETFAALKKLNQSM